MINWKNMDTLAAYAELKAAKPVNVKEVMSGENGAERVKAYSAPMGGKMDFNYGARPVDDKILSVLAKFADEAQLDAGRNAQTNDGRVQTGHMIGAEHEWSAFRHIFCSAQFQTEPEMPENVHSSVCDGVKHIKHAP